MSSSHRGGLFLTPQRRRTHASSEGPRAREWCGRAGAGGPGVRREEGHAGSQAAGAEGSHPRADRLDGDHRDPGDDIADGQVNRMPRGVTMRPISGLALMAGLGMMAAGLGRAQPSGKTAPPAKGDSYVLGFTMKRLDGTEESLERYRGKVIVLVNVASKCGYTPQYEGLERLYEAKK